MPPAGPPPFVRLGFFWKPLSRSSQLMLGLLLAATAIGAGLLVWASEYPFDSHTRWNLVADDVPSEVVVATVESNYRPLNLTAQAYLPFLQPTPSPISTGDGWVGLVALLSILGWAALLAAFTRVEGFWGYLILFLFSSYLYLGRFAKVLTGNPDLLLAGSAGLIVLFLVLAYLIQLRLVRLSVAGAFALFAGLLGVLHGLAWQIGGSAGLFEVVWAPVVVLFVIGVLALLLVAKDLSAIALYAATNARKPEHRLGYGGTLAVLGAVVLLGGLCLAQAYELVPRQDLVIRPAWLVAPALLLTLFTTQNAYFQVSDLIPAPVAYGALLQGMALLLLTLLLGSLFFADHSLAYQLDRLVAGAFFGVSLAYWIYVAANFKSRLRARLNVYYILMFARVFRFEVIWMIALSLLLLLEGAYSWRSYYALMCSIKNTFADAEYLADAPDQALLWYEQAAGFMPHDIKANYNAAQLFLTTGSYVNDPSQVPRLIKLLEASDHRGQFPQGAAALALFLQISRQPEEALERLRLRPPGVQHPQLDALRAALFFQTNQPDSAIYYFKQSLEQKPGQAHLFLNLGHLYLAYQRPELARTYLNAAARLSPDDPYVRQARIFVELERPSGAIQAHEVAVSTHVQHYAANYNLAWLAFQQGRYELADTLAGALLQQAQRPEVFLLRLTAQAFMDSIGNALSRYYWLGENHPDYRASAAHNLALYYHSKGLSEVAEYLFGEAVAAGWETQRIEQALMWADLGQHDRAYRQLAVCRADFPAFDEPIRREMALLDFAHGTELRFLPWDFKGITYHEAMRGGIYGRQANNNLEPALRFYQPLVDQDSSLTAPYLEIGRIYNNLGEYETGNLQFLFGLERDPKDIPLRAELARGYYSSQQTERGDSLLALLAGEQGQHPEVLRLQGFAAEMKGQPERALTFYEQLAASQPFDRSAYLAAAPLYERLRRTEDGLRLLGQALRFNKRNPELWYWYARFAGPFGLEDDARGAFAQAVELAATEADRQRYRRGQLELGF